MATPFDALASELNAAVNALRGEPFTLLPMHRPDRNARPVSDPDRAPAEFTGTFDDMAARVGSGVEGFDVGSLRKGHPGHTSDRPTAWVERTALPYRPREGDVLRRTATGAEFRIGEVLQSGSLFVLQLHR